MPVFFSAQENHPDISKYFMGKPGAMVIYDCAKKEYFRYNAKRCTQRFLPASTFKIPNSLIGLETGIIPDENYVIKWDGIERDNKEWNRDHTLASAIEYSVVPYYQELARRVGRLKMQSYLKKLKYGNMKIGTRVDTFWLDNSLKISANEEAEFLIRFYGGKLPFSQKNIDIVKKIMPEEVYPKSKLKFKTGMGKKENGVWIGWLVGYVEQENNTYIFAFNIEGENYDNIKELRDKNAREILKALKIIL